LHEHNGRIELSRLRPAEITAQGGEKGEVYSIEITGRLPEERDIIVTGAKR
jgi:hypothetical protein